MNAKLRYALLAAGSFVAVLVASHALLARLDVPYYGSWTGIRPLETKLQMLQEFDEKGAVDALVLGSSIVDFGFSAELYSELMSRHLGRPYRAFNFAAGGAEPRTLPKLYRLARTVSKPKAVLVVVPAEEKLANEFAKNSPDRTLENAPVGGVLNHPFLLNLNRFLWDTPILRSAPAIRDLALFGEFRNLQSAVGMEAYAVTGHGDRVSYLMTWKAQDLPIYKNLSEKAMTRLTGSAASAEEKLQLQLRHHFAQMDIDAMEELKQLVRQDGGKIYLLSHAGAAALWNGLEDDQEHARVRQDFFGAMAAKLDATFWDVMSAVRVPAYCISDVTHLNVYGAEAYTRVAFATAIGKASGAADQAARRVTMAVPPDGLFPTSDRTFTPYSALLRRPADQHHPLLRVRTVRSLAVPALPAEDLFLALRMPDNSDIVVPAFALGPGDFVAEPELPRSALTQGIVVRVLHGYGAYKTALPNPVADYEWITSYPRFPVPGLAARGDLQVLAMPPLRTAGETLYIALKPGKPLARELGLHLAPLSAAPGAAVLDLGEATTNTEGLFKAALPQTLAPGTYQVQVIDPSTRTELGRSQTVQVAEAVAAREPPKLVAEARPKLASGSAKVAWSGIRKPTPQDWIGLFPVGGKPDSRLNIVFIKGKPQGEIQFPIPEVIVPKLASGVFEFRLYASGGWIQLAQSEAVEFEAPRVIEKPQAESKPQVPSSVRIAVEARPKLDAGAVKVSWTGIANPSAEDWIGLFPAAGKAESRMDFVFTKGQPDGELAFPLSPFIASKLATGEYEFRLYTKGWVMLAQSDRVRFAAR